ncbi:hypothetical protein [Kineococcus radiotolerans]|uniref:hypothetical protein n=1 Tax=Kineococcus radiotolerans TaxID=131568 RepID=UPI00030245DE|nr:hypothetical protein [Kineococcus radiotolerans]
MDDLPTRFAAARARRADPARPELAATALAAACCDVLAVDGAVVSVAGRDAWRLPVGASDDAAAAAERWRFTVGQGPGGGDGAAEPLVVDADGLRTRWPALHDQLRRHTPFRSTVTLPLRLLLPGGATGPGVLDLHLHRERPLAPPGPGAAPLDLGPARRVAALVGAGLDATGAGATGAGAGEGHGEPDWMDAPTARARQRVWMVISMAQQVLAVERADALALLRATAYVQDRTLEDLAEDVVAGRTPLGSLRG